MKTLIPFAALAAILPLVPVTATVPARTQVVRFSAHDLATPRARTALDRRIARAAEEVCGTPSLADLVGQNDLRDCRRQAVAAASADLAISVASQRGAVLVAANR